QTKNLLGTKNFRVYLEETGPDAPPGYRIAISVERGRLIEREKPERLNGLAQYVVDRSTSLLADPIEDAAAKLNVRNLPAARAWMGVPLMTSTRLIGAMVVWLEHGEQPDRNFSQDDMEAFSAVAEQTSVALENAFLFESSVQHGVQLERLNEISNVVNATLNPEQVLELVAEAVIDVAGSDKAALYLLETDTTEPSLILAHARGLSREHIVRSRDIALPLTSHEYNQLMREGVSVMVSDIEAADADISQGYACLPRTRASVAMPIFRCAPKANLSAFSPSTMIIRTISNRARLACWRPLPIRPP
ncbi:MAG: GAF domain-containing protein, partial [Chloroflexi bacterium]|nr:GAF domain-containing protein [Chloroflexota bacterium]